MERSNFAFIFLVIFPGTSFADDAMTPADLLEACNSMSASFGERASDVSFKNIAGNIQNSTMRFMAIPYAEGGCGTDNTNFFLGVRKNGAVPVNFRLGFSTPDKGKTFVMTFIADDNCESATTPKYIEWHRNQGYAITTEVDAALRRVVVENICPAEKKAVVTLVGSAFPTVTISKAVLDSLPH